MINSHRSEYSLQRQRLTVHLSVIAALLLTLYPYGLEFQVIAPDWLALIILYWLARDERHFGHWHLFSYGIIHDLLHFNFVGAESIGLLIACFLFLRYRMFFQFLPKIGQLMVILLLLLIKQFCILWILSLTGEPPGAATYLLPPLVGAALWLGIERLPLNKSGRGR